MASDSVCVCLILTRLHDTFVDNQQIAYPQVLEGKTGDRSAYPQVVYNQQSCG